MSSFEHNPVNLDSKLYNLQLGLERKEKEMDLAASNDPEYKKYLTIAYEDYPKIFERQKPSVSIMRLLTDEPKYMDAILDIAQVNAIKSAKNCKTLTDQHETMQEYYDQLTSRAGNIIINNPEFELNKNSTEQEKLAQAMININLRKLRNPANVEFEAHEAIAMIGGLKAKTTQVMINARYVYNNQENVNQMRHESQQESQNNQGMTMS